MELNQFIASGKRFKPLTWLLDNKDEGIANTIDTASGVATTYVVANISQTCLVTYLKGSIYNSRGTWKIIVDGETLIDHADAVTGEIVSNDGQPLLCTASFYAEFKSSASITANDDIGYTIQLGEIVNA